MLSEFDQGALSLSFKADMGAQEIGDRST